jgi:predicted RNA-binding protein YlqC (UPF0109 family)
MKSFVADTLRRFTDHPSDLTVTSFEGKKTIVLEVRCHADDLGKVIGKNGKVIQAVRTLANVLGENSNRRVIVEVVE